MRSRTATTLYGASPVETHFTSLLHAERRARLRLVPRSVRKPQDTPEARALDEVAHAYELTEAKLDRLRGQLKAAVVVAVRAGMTKAEAARRAGYSREFVSKLVSESDRAANGA